MGYSSIKKYAKDFNEYITNSVKNSDKKSLLSIMNKEIFYQNHPTSEHFLPLLITFGNAINKKGHSFNSEIVYSNISMESYIFDF